MAEIDHHQVDPAQSVARRSGGPAETQEFGAPSAETTPVLRDPKAGGLPPGVVRAQLLAMQRTAGNRAAQSFLGSSGVTVQRKGPSLSGIKKAVGLGNKPSGPAAKAEQAGAQAKSATIVTVSDLETQVSTLEAATRKLIKAHQPGDGASQRAAFGVHAAAERIRGNLPDQNSKASKVLGRTYPDQVRKLRWIIDETQLILDEVRVENTRRQAENIYLEGGRGPGTQPGALTRLTTTAHFAKSLDRPAPNAEVAAHLQEHGFRTYEEAYEDALAKERTNPRSDAEGALRRLHPQLFSYTERARSRASAQTLGLSAAELAGIQTYSVQDYRYINPATANDPAWLAKNFPSLADKPDKTLEDWAALQDDLAAKGQTLDQRMAARRGELTTLREEGGLHAGVTMQGLLKLPVWKGLAYRGERLSRQRFYPRFVKKGDTFAPRDPTFTWKTITSISKSEHKAGSFSMMGEGSYVVVYEFEVTNGRDIERLSLNRSEQEVALLPGAQFAYGPIEVVTVGKHVEGFGEVAWQLRIKAKQIT